MLRCNMQLTDRSRTFTWSDPLASLKAIAGRPGLEAMRAIAGGEVEPPPIARLLGMEIVEVERGRVAFALTPAEWMYNPIGSVHGGVAATLLDSALGCAVHTTLGADQAYTTADLQVRFLRPMSADTGRVIADATVVHTGRRLATAEARLTAEEGGKLLAHGSTSCLIIG
jgi:uncharacterized protein (TIGR00369 family)